MRTPHSVPIAVAARDEAKTRAFAREHGIPTVHGHPTALINDPEVDVVYIATPHPLHHDLALEAIAAGKHVLIEKPIAMSSSEARTITDAGRAAGVLVMEAMWTRYLPQADIIRQILADGLLGDVHLVRADFGFLRRSTPEPDVECRARRRCSARCRCLSNLVRVIGARGANIGHRHRCAHLDRS